MAKKTIHQALLAAGCACVLVTLPRVAHAQRAAYATPDELPSDGLPHLLDVALLGEYARVDDRDDAGGLRHVAAFALRSRLYIGRTLNYCGGLDGKLGGSNSGFVYDVSGYLAGLGVRWGAGNVISLCGGVGLDRQGSAVPRSTKFPVELSTALDFGPIRPIVWLRPQWVTSDARADGASTELVDELEVGLLVRLSKQHRYWSRTSAGGGLAIGALYREFMGTYAIGGMIGVDFVGEQ